MKDSYPDPPLHRPALTQRLANLVSANTAQRTTQALAGVIVGQMMPAGVVKGGTAMKLRLGQTGSRFSTDFDLARRGEYSDFLDDLDSKLAAGWAGFTGQAVRRPPPRPAGVPTSYVMQPLEIKLQYRGRSWLTILMEVGHDELDDTVDPPLRLTDELRNLVVALGLPAPQPIPVLAVEHQVAQKLHASSEPGSERAHDLVDLQLLAREPDFDPARTVDVCRRLFVFRKKHTWPPNITVNANWTTLYATAAEGLEVAPDVESAARWGNEFVAQLDRQR